MILREISAKVRSQTRLTRDDALALFASANLLETCHLAAEQSALKNGRRVFYNENRFVRTKLSLKPAVEGDRGRPTLDPSSKQQVEQMVERATRLVTKTTTEIRFGSINPKALSFEMLLGAVKTLRKRFPRVRIRALGAPDVDAYARHENTNVERIVAGLMEAGAAYLDGRGAGVFGADAHLGNLSSHGNALTAERWLGIHRTAHRMGLVSDATMSYGLGESAAARVDHLLALRALQDETGGFVSFIPLSNQYQEPEQGFHRRTFGLDDITMIAIARLVLDNFLNLRANWGRLGMDMAQLMLEFGANELEGSVSNDNNSRVAGARPFRSMNRNEIESLIRKTGNVAAERDGFYQPVRSAEPPLPVTDDITLQRLLYKAEKGHELNEEEATFVARGASLTTLGYCAQIKKESTMPRGHASLVTDAWDLEQLLTGAVGPADHVTISPRLAFLDLDALAPRLPDLNLKAVVATLDIARHRHPRMQLVVKGLKGMFLVARRSGETVQGVLKALKDANVTTIESSSFEPEDDLTVSEVVQTHKAIHKADIASVAKIELQAQYNGTSLPFWESYVQRLMALIRLQTESRGLVGLKIEAAKGSRISPSEYMRAISLARIVAHNVANIIAPFGRIPSLVHSFEPEKSSRSRDVLKIAPVCMLFGANDLDYVRLDSVNTRLIWDELAKSGLTPSLRDSRFNLIS